MSYSILVYSSSFGVEDLIVPIQKKQSSPTILFFISSKLIKSDLIISIRESSNSGVMRTKSFIFLYLLLPKIKSKIFFPINPEEPNINAVFISY